MRQNTTPGPDSLTPTQETALAALLTGKPVTEAASAAQVDRSTVHRWLKTDFAFQAALNCQRRAMREAMQARLMSLAERAADCVERSIADGDGKTALALLKGLGLLSGEPTPIGSDDPGELSDKAAERAMLRGMFRP